jgi:presenilin-like A22 family membrane protease
MRLVMTLLALFVLAQLLGIYTGMIVITDLTQNPLVSSLVVTADTQEPLNAVFFILYILLGAVMMILMIRLLGMYPIIFRIMEFMLIATSSSIVFYAFLRIFAAYEFSTITAVVMGLAFSGIKVFMPSLKNTAAVLATAGVGVVFGISLGLIPLILFLILLSVYDYISVFTTKHMVEMANYIVKRNLAFTITARRKPKKKGEPERRIDLGTGDVIAPIMLEVSALSVSPTATIFVFIGAVVSMGIFLNTVWKKGTVLPALPPVVLGMIVSLMIGLLLGFY